ncbi:hypothetical protein [uncultured Gammaproteobacteria bacterium]|nr:hypothetical protein [uncultured Gammaproteobacteria bacterium]
MIFCGSGFLNFTTCANNIHLSPFNIALSGTSTDYQMYALQCLLK